MALPKPCYRCGKKIENPSKAQKICDECSKISRALAFPQSRTGYKVYTRMCNCKTLYRTIYKYSDKCPNCDTSKNKSKRNLNKRII